MPMAVVYRELAQDVVLHNDVRTYIGCLLGFWQFYNEMSPTFHCSFFMSGVKIINFRVMCMFEPLQSFLMADMQNLLIFRGFDSLEVLSIHKCQRLMFILVGVCGFAVYMTHGQACKAGCSWIIYICMKLHVVLSTYME